jgi:hypothetical protein
MAASCLILFNLPLPLHLGRENKKQEHDPIMLLLWFDSYHLFHCLAEETSHQITIHATILLFQFDLILWFVLSLHSMVDETKCDNSTITAAK